MARTSDSPATLVARYSVAIYFLAALMLLMPPLDIVLSLPQYAWGSARWRFGALGLISGGMLLPIAGLLLASITAVCLEQRWMHRFILVMSVAMAIVFLVVMGLFGLDALQVRREATPEVLRRFDIAVIKTLFMQLVQTIAAVLIARSAWRASRSLGAGREADRPQELFAGTLGR